MKKGEFKFIHCADLHVGTPFKNLMERDEEIFESLLESTYASFDNIMDLAIREEVAFVLVAGDLLETSVENLRALSHIQRGFLRLKEKGIGVFMVHGNHDPYKIISQYWRFPDNCYTFSYKNTQWKRIVLPSGQRIAIFGRSFKNQEERGNLVKFVPELKEEAFKIALFHLTVGGQTGHIPYAPCKISELDQRADYWALGHIHKPQVLSKSPYIVYSGNIQGRHMKELGPRGCFLVTVKDKWVERLNFVPTAPFIWDEIQLDLFDVSETQCLLERIEETISEKKGLYPESGLLLKIILKGPTTLSKDLLRPEYLQEIKDFLNDQVEQASPIVRIVDLINDTSPKEDLKMRKELKDLPGYCLREADLLKIAPETLLAHKDLKELFNKKGISQITKDEVVGLIERSKYLLLNLLEAEDIIEDKNN